MNNVYSLRHEDSNGRTELHHFRTDKELNLSEYYFDVDTTPEQLEELNPILEGLGLSYIDVINNDDIVEIDSVELKIIKIN